MIELLRRISDEDPGREAVCTHDRSYSYAELVEAAETTASAFVAAGITRAAVIEVEAFEVIAALAGASAAGTELCLYPPEPDQVDALRSRFDHDRVFGPGELSAFVAATTAKAVAGTAPVSRPHLVLTTGTTGAPRGVRHDWDRLLRGVGHVGSGAGQRWLLAFGLHQFAGLQLVLHVMAAGATLVAPAPRRPREGLRAIRELGVTHASATPTFWRFLLAEMKAGSHETFPLRQITLGGEAAPPGVLEALHRTFPSAQISHVYAASEFGSTGSVSDGRPGLPVAVLEREPGSAVEMKIVDGELWVRSHTGMLGYYGEDDVDADGWRATGDLVEVVGDRLEFRGRDSEVINVGGVKVHPLPVEDRVAAVPGVTGLRVYGRPNAVAGAIVAVEIVVEPGADPDDVVAAVRESCAELPGAAQPRSIKVVADIETKGDKVIRRAP